MHFALAFLLPGLNIFPPMEPDVSITTQILNFMAWLKTHLKQVIQWAGIIIVVACLLGYFVYNRSQREVRASEALADIRTPSNPSQPTPPDQAQAFVKVANEYPGTKAAARALLDAGGAFFVQGNYVESQKQFDRVLKDYPESPWRAEAQLGIGADLEALGKTNDAAAKYDEVRKNATAAVADEAKLNLARLYEAQGRQVEAVKMYDELVKAYPYSGLGAEAGMRMEDLTNRVPALATNLVPLTPPPSAMTMMTNRFGTNRIAMSNLQNRITNIIRMTNAPTPRPGASATPPPVVVPKSAPAPATPPATTPAK